MKLNNCTLVWWVVATTAGVATFSKTNEATSVFVAILLGGAMFALVGFSMTRLFCQGTGAGVVDDSRFTGPAIGSDTPSIVGQAARAAMARRPVAYTPPPAAAFGAQPGAQPAAALGAQPGDHDATTTAKQKAAPATAEVTPDYDGDGRLEGADEGTRPAGLDGPRDGKADNLKEIKGIGPKLEKMCNAMGFYHFDQIAAWTADEVAWVNANLQGFKGRVTRDNWIAQARILAAGGETEFSRRVEDGDVYQ